MIGDVNEVLHSIRELRPTRRIVVLFGNLEELDHVSAADTKEDEAPQ